jgi:hypothetical protein
MAVGQHVETAACMHDALMHRQVGFGIEVDQSVVDAARCYGTETFLQRAAEWLEVARKADNVAKISRRVSHALCKRVDRKQCAVRLDHTRYMDRLARAGGECVRMCEGRSGHLSHGRNRTLAVAGRISMSWSMSGIAYKTSIHFECFY